MRTLVLSLVIPVFAVGRAFAHGGHIGDLAGHSHWLGWAAAAGAGALAAWAIKRGAGRKPASGAAADDAGTGAKPKASEG